MSGLLDTRNNLLTAILVIALGGLGVIAVGQTLLMGRVNLDRIPASGQSDMVSGEVDAPETGLADFASYTAITDRPVFFSDRRLPVVEVVEVPEDMPDPDPGFDDPDPVEDLRAAVAGIIITPELRMAMIRDDAANKTMVLREGMSLEGEQAAWRLDQIASRSVSFVSVDGRESALELKVNTAGLTAGSPGQITTPASQRAQEAEAPASEESAEQRREATETGDNDARARAEEVRRRVAERRAELRAEAERRAQMQRQRQDNQ